MGGGPRTFPGGLSKWQYKRMHEKLAREKERGLLRHEKQLYLARLRSEIRASHFPGASSPAAPDHGSRGPTSSRAHVRSLADRFLQPGAEDLWNEDDGPLRRPHPQPARSLPSSARMVDWGEKPPGAGGDWKHLEELNSDEPRTGRGTGNEPQLPVLNLKRGFSQRREYGTVAPWWWQWSPGSGTPSQRKGTSLGFFGPKRCYSVMPPCLPNQGSSAALIPLGDRQLAEVRNGREWTPLARFYQESPAVAGRRFGPKWKPDSSDEDEDDMPAARRGI